MLATLALCASSKLMMSKPAILPGLPSARLYAATVRLKRHALCAEKPVRLSGQRVGSTLSWTPAMSDFGSVTVGSSARLAVTVRNLLFRPVTLSNVRTSDRFSAPSSATVPPGRRNEAGTITAGEVTFEISFAPSVAGPRAGVLWADVTAAPLVKRLVALLPPPNRHLTSFHGVYPPTRSCARA